MGIEKTGRLGILGGTFNPPHIGHLEAARHVREALGLDRVLFIPTNIPPHKRLPKGSATPAQRLEMVQCMLREEPWAQASDMELTRGGASYTVDTLARLRDTAEHLTLILGTDMLLTFTQWYAPEKICRLASLAVVARDEGDCAALEQQVARLREQFGAEVTLVRCASIPISSTEVREGRLDLSAVTAPVADYIREHGLYRYGAGA